MKKIVISGFTTFGLLLSISTHAAWFEQNHDADNQFFQDIEALSETQAVAVGDDGVIMYTIDGGDTWQSATESTDAFLYSLEQNDGVNMFTVGENAEILKSEDGGLNWMTQVSAATKDLYAIDTFTNKRAMAVGEDGTVVFTTNNGTVWNKSTNKTNEDLLGVAYMKSTEAVVVGEFGKIMKTLDSGETWSNRNSGTDEDLHDVVFLTSSLGFAVGNNGTVIKTTDSALTWETVDINGLTSENLLAIDNLDEDSLIIAGSGKVFISHDAGLTWAEEEFVNNDTFFFGISYASNDIHYGAGTDLVSSSTIFKFDSSVAAEEEVVEETVEEVEELTVTSGTLISLECSDGTDSNDPCKAVYYVGEDGKRHAFPNDKVYFSWYDNFDDVVDVDADTLASFSLGNNVTYKPGVRMVKFVTVNTVYAVESGGVLRGIDSEDIASELYGSDWNQQIDDISDTFIGNYSFGDEIQSAADYDPTAAQNSVVNIDDSL